MGKRNRRIRYIILPSLRPTIVILLLLKELSSLGFCPQEGEAPFILFSIPKKYNAKTFYDKMIKDHGILLRNCSNFHGLDDHYFRIGIKKHEENVELMKALKNVSSYCSQGTRLQQ